MTSESERLLVAAVKALGGCPDDEELGVMRTALLSGPADLARELRLAMSPGEEGSRAAFQRLADVVRAGEASPFTMLDLCSSRGRRWMPEGGR